MSNFENAKKSMKICWNIEVWAVQKHVNLVDLVKSWKPFQRIFPCKIWRRYSRERASQSSVDYPALGFNFHRAAPPRPPNPATGLSTAAASVFAWTSKWNQWRLSEELWNTGITIPQKETRALAELSDETTNGFPVFHRFQATRWKFKAVVLWRLYRKLLFYFFYKLVYILRFF